MVLCFSEISKVNSIHAHLYQCCNRERGEKPLLSLFHCIMSYFLQPKPIKLFMFLLLGNRLGYKYKYPRCRLAQHILCVDYTACLHSGAQGRRACDYGFIHNHPKPAFVTVTNLITFFRILLWRSRKTLITGNLYN